MIVVATSPALLLVAASAAAAPAPAPSLPSEAFEADLQRRCDAADAAACTRLGEVHHAGDATHPDVHRAEALWTRACDRGHLPACVDLGQLWLVGWAQNDLERSRGEAPMRPIAPRPARAKRLFQRACDRGHGPGCTALARTRTDGAGRYDKKGCALLQRACTRGDEAACGIRTNACRGTTVRVRAEGGDLFSSAVAVDRDGLILVEGPLSGAPRLRIARFDPAGTLKPLGTVPKSDGWPAVAACPDGKTAWVAGLSGVTPIDGATPGRPIALPPVPGVDTSMATTSLMCLADGSVVVVRWCPTAVPTDADDRALYSRVSARLVTPAITKVEHLELSVDPYTLPREVERVRQLAGELAAAMREGAAWDAIAARARDGWPAVSATDTTATDGPVGLVLAQDPPDEVHRLPVGAVAGPFERLEPARQGRQAHQKGSIHVWRVASRTPARAPDVAEGLALLRKEGAARALELWLVTRDGVRAQRRLVTRELSNRAIREGLGPIVPLDDGFALLGADRAVYRRGRWEPHPPLFAAIADLPVSAAARIGSRIVMLFWQETFRGRGPATLGILDENGRLLAKVPVRDAAGNAVLASAVGPCGTARVCAVAGDLGRSTIVVFDIDGRPVAVDVSGAGSSVARPSFSEAGLWLRAEGGGRIVRYRDRRTTVYDFTDSPF
jgi:hypothetical protein